MKGVKAERPLAESKSKESERRPRREHARKFQQLTAVIASRPLKDTLEILLPDHPELAAIKRKAHLLRYLCQHEEVARLLGVRV